MDLPATLSKPWPLTGAFVVIGLLGLLNGAACTGSKVTPIPASPWDAGYLSLPDSAPPDLPPAADAPTDTRPGDTARDPGPDRVPDGTGKEVTPDLSFDLTSPPETRDGTIGPPRDVAGN